MEATWLSIDRWMNKDVVCERFPSGSGVKNLPAMQERNDAGLIPGWGRAPGGGHGNPLQYACLDNLMDRGAWQATGHGVSKSQTQVRQLNVHVVYKHTMDCSVQCSSVQSLSRVRLFATPWTAARQASLSITNSWSSLRLTSIESVMPSSHLILCRPLLLLPPIPPSIRVFSNESTLCMRWPKYWSFSFSITPSKEHPGLISFRMDWTITQPHTQKRNNAISSNMDGPRDNHSKWSKSEKDKHHMCHLYMESLKMIHMSLYTEQKQTHRRGKQTYSYQRGMGGIN